MGQNIYIRPLMPRAQLAERQERIKDGLLKSGMALDEIRDLMWYDVSLEDQFRGPQVDDTHEGDDGKHWNPEPFVNPKATKTETQPIGDKKLSRAERYRLRKGDGNP